MVFAHVQQIRVEFGGKRTRRRRRTARTVLKNVFARQCEAAHFRLDRGKELIVGAVLLTLRQLLLRLLLLLLLLLLRWLRRLHWNSAPVRRRWT